MIENPGSQLLYRSASGLERAMADADAERLVELRAEILKDIWDPFAIPFELLPYLAWAMGVNFWNDEWSEETKRNWVARQWEFKSLRGTEDGLRMAVDFAGRDVSTFGYKVVKITTRPQAIFAGKSLTKAEREEWLDRLPQVRVYTYSEATAALPFKLFYGSAWTRLNKSKHFFRQGLVAGVKTPQNFPIPSKALDHLQRRAVWNVNGVDTDVKVGQFGNYFQLYFNGDRGYRTLLNDKPGRSFFVPSDAEKRLTTIAPKSLTPWRVGVGPSLEAVNAEPESVSVPGTRGRSVFAGSRFFRGGGSKYGDGRHHSTMVGPYPSFYLPSTSGLRLYNRYSVYDPNILPTLGRPSTAFWGVGRYGFPDFTAEAEVFIPSKRAKFAMAFGDIPVPHTKFMVPHDPSKMLYVRQAIESSRRLADKILLRTGPVASFVAGKPFIAGNDFIVGQPNAEF